MFIFAAIYKALTSALLMTDPMPQPITRTATIAAAAVSWNLEEKFVKISTVGNTDVE